MQCQAVLHPAIKMPVYAVVTSDRELKTAGSRLFPGCSLHFETMQEFARKSDHNLYRRHISAGGIENKLDFRLLMV